MVSDGVKYPSIDPITGGEFVRAEEGSSLALAVSGTALCNLKDQISEVEYPGGLLLRCRGAEMVKTCNCGMFFAVGFHDKFMVMGYGCDAPSNMFLDDVLCAGRRL